VKDTEFSINNKKDREEFNDYFLLFLRTEKQKRFKFYIFTKKIRNIKMHKEIFEKYKIESICEKIENDLTSDDLQFFKSVDNEDKKDFFCSTTLIQADIDDLKKTIALESGKYPEDDIYSKYKYHKDEVNVVDKNEILISNLKEIKNLKFIWSAETEITSEREVRDLVAHPPPYTIYENKIISIYPFLDYNVLTKIVDTTNIEKIRVKDWLNDENERKVIIGLLNRMCVKYCQLIGLFRKSGEFIFYFPDVFQKESIKEPWEIREPQLGKIEFKKRKSHRIIFKKFFKDTLNSYYLHPAVNFEVLYFDKKLFFAFIPKKVFTKDGRNEVHSKRAKKLDGFFRNPLFSRNRNLLLEQLFWAYVLFLSPYLRQKRINHPNKKSQEIEFHILEILKFIGNEYFTTIISNNSPDINENELQEENLDNIFKYITRDDN